MNNLSLRFSFHRFWNHFYYSSLNWDKKYPIPNWLHVKQDLFIQKILLGFFPFQKFHIQKSRDLLIIYLFLDKFISFNFFPLFPLQRLFFNLFKCKVHFHKIYTFPLDDVHLILPSLLRDPTFKLSQFLSLWQKGLILGIKIIIKGRFKKSSRTQTDIYQFGKIPNTPSKNLNLKLFYTSYPFSSSLHSLGSSSIHLFIYYP